jgi:hypothetical protein
MNSPEPRWRTVDVREREGLRTVTLSAIEQGTRIWKEETWRIPADPEEDRSLLTDRTIYWTRDKESPSTTWQQALLMHPANTSQALLPAH